MPERITSSSELRGFVADNTGRRKIDTEASLELHVRAATQIDLLTQELEEFEERSKHMAAAPPAPAPAEQPTDPSSSAMMLLRNAQVAADETLTEAADMRAKAAAALAEAEARAKARAEEATAEAMARAEQAIADARLTADRTLADAQSEADRARADARNEAARIVELARAEADSIADATGKVRDRAEFIQRQYLDKAGIVRREAEALADFSRQVETFAKSDMVLPPFDPDAVEPANAAPAHEATSAAETDEPVAAAAAAPAPAAEPAPAPAPIAEPVIAPDHPAIAESPAAATPDSHLALVADEPDAALPPPPPPPAITEEPAAPAASAEFLPPPPKVDVLDLTEDELADVLDGRSIDDELFDDDEVIDLTDGADNTSDNFQFFGRD